MNYQQIKTIKKYSINKNLLLAGLLISASFVQGCQGTGKAGNATSGNSINKTALLGVIGQFDDMTSTSFKHKLVANASDNAQKPVKVKLAIGEVETFKLAEKLDIVDKDTQGTKKLPYFEALKSDLVKDKNGVWKRERVVEKEEITGLFKTTLDKFSKKCQYKNAKVFVLVRLLELQEAIRNTTSNENIQTAIATFRNEIDKVKDGAPGVLAKIDAQGDIEFVDLTQEDQNELKGLFKTQGKSAKYTLSKELYEFIDTNVVKEIEKTAATK